MAYKKDDIVYRAKSMLGESFREGTEDSLEAICIAAMQTLESRLRVDVCRSDIEVIMISAASLLAVSMYMELRRGTQSCDSFSAGNVSVKLKNSAPSSDTLRDQAEALIKPYTDCGGFSFVGVRS